MDNRSLLALLELQVLMAGPIKRIQLRHHLRFLRMQIQLQEQGREPNTISSCMYDRLTMLYSSEKISNFEMDWMRQVIALLECMEHKAVKQEEVCKDGEV